jgi:hypothetical protein
MARIERRWTNVEIILYDRTDIRDTDRAGGGKMH